MNRWSSKLEREGFNMRLKKTMLMLVITPFVPFSCTRTPALTLL